MYRYCRIQALQHALTGFARSMGPVPVVAVEALDDSKLTPVRSSFLLFAISLLLILFFVCSYLY